MIEVQVLQQHIAAERLGVSRAWVYRACARLGLATQRTGPRAGAGAPTWKGGKKILKGYLWLWQPDHPRASKSGYVAEHRLIAEGMLGRHLLRSEVVHHRDGDPMNNSPANLQVFDSNADHLRHELSGRIPNWTEDGKRRIAAGVQKAASIRRAKSALDGGQQPLRTDHPT
jgi:hypothetical protein